MRSTFEARGYTAWDPDEPALAAGEPERLHAGHSDGVRELDGEALDKKTPLLRTQEALSVQALRILKLFGSDRHARHHDVRSRAGILPDRPPLLLQPPRSHQRGPHAVRRQAAEGPGDRGPVLRRHPRARARVHDGSRGRALQVRRAREDAPQRGRAEPVRDCAGLRERQRRDRSPDDGHGDAQARRAEIRPGVPAPREAVCRRQRIRQAPELEHGR